MCKGGSRTVTSQQAQSQQQNQTARGSDESMYWAGQNLGNAANLLTGPAQYAHREIAPSNLWTDLPVQEAYRLSNLTRGNADLSQQALGRAQRDVNVDPIVLDDANIRKYFNPYSSYVEDGLNRDLGMGTTALRSANSAAMGGVGGDRAAVSEALKHETDQLARGKLRANMWDTSRNTAFGVDTSNRDAKYQADIGNRQNDFNLANAYGQSYQYGQNRLQQAANFMYGLEQNKNDSLYQANKDYQSDLYRRGAAFDSTVRGSVPATGMNTSGTSFGNTYGTQETSTQQDPLSTIMGLAMTGIGLATGNPMMAMGGMGGSMGGLGKGSGGGTGYSTNPWSSGGVFGGGSGSGWGSPGAMSGWYRRGGRVRVPKKADGGALSFFEMADPVNQAIDRGTFMPRYEEQHPLRFPAAIPDTPYLPRNFNERAQPHIDAMGTGEFDPQGAAATDFRSSPALEASNAGIIPLPRERPEGAGPGNIGAVAGLEEATSRANPYAASPPRAASATSEDYDITLPPAPQYRQYERPTRNWSEFLLRAGLATLAARGDTDGGGVPKGSIANIGKGTLSALDHEDKERELARKENESQNYNITLGDNASLKREQLKISRQNAMDSAEERRLSRQSMDEYRRAQIDRQTKADEERARHNQVEEARRGFIAQQRDEQLKMGKPFSDDNIVYKAQVRADNWRKEKTALINSGVLRKDAIDLEEGWQKVFDETKKAMLEAREQAFARMRKPQTVP